MVGMNNMPTEVLDKVKSHFSYYQFGDSSQESTNELRHSTILILELKRFKSLAN